MTEYLSTSTTRLGNDYRNLRYNRITNCILNIPQDIKVESDGTSITIKAGTKTYIPNGFNSDGSRRFDEYILENDIVGIKGTEESNIGMIRYLSLYNTGGYTCLTYASSGTSGYSGNLNYIWYNLTDNKIYRYTRGVLDTTRICSFPILRTINRLGYQSDGLLQIFNGFGFFGNLTFCLPGIKALIPNGRNPDGTLRSKLVESKLNFFSVEGWPSIYQEDVFLNENGSIVNAHCANQAVFYSSVLPTQTSHFYWYNELENQWYENAVATNILTKRSLCPIYSIRYENNLISQILNKNTLECQDSYSLNTDKGLISSKAINLTLGSSGSSYVMPADGWLFIDKLGNINEYVVFRSNMKDGEYNYVIKNSGNHATLIYPVRKSEVISVYYNLTGKLDFFNFYYST